MRGTTFEIARFFIWAVLAVFLMFPGALGCGGGASNGSGGGAGSGSGESETTKVPPDPGEGDPLGAKAPGDKDGKGKGWRWKGKRDHCYYVFDNQCFEDRKAACEAAGCKSGCADDDGAPAKVSCAK